MILAFRRSYPFPCIAGTQAGHNCARRAQGLQLEPAEVLAGGAQPMCWQHRDAIEAHLERLSLGIDEVLSDNHAIDPSRLYLGPGVAHHAEGCRAFVDTDLKTIARPTQLVVLPLCREHANGLTAFFKAERADDAMSVPWGWRAGMDQMTRASSSRQTD